MKRVRVLVGDHPRLRGELILAELADPDIKIIGALEDENELTEAKE